jgi:hypothetical protein
LEVNTGFRIGVIAGALSGHNQPEHIAGMSNRLRPEYARISGQALYSFSFLSKNNLRRHFTYIQLRKLFFPISQIQLSSAVFSGSFLINKDIISLIVLCLSLEASSPLTDIHRCFLSGIY